ncbi:hypothetical protein [Maribacter sp. ACAM166]|uniref:hypothetical protein n=1 Tax=Maribacter sp. ACAM166 TaxID=2508996 RepID=UPI0010FE28D2|nr:hypothetical protein [Maribacter sp. ACAM166]TLP75657.1 hypothetical protein ES765_15090 [Maribacter sp. ACAM166]
MRQFYTLTLILIFSTSFLCGQTADDLNKELDSLTLILEKVNLKINEFNNQKTEIRQQISELNQKKNKIELENEFAIGIPVTINYMGGTLRDKPNISGSEIIKIPTGDTILIFNCYEKPYFKAAYKEKVGYISHSSLNNNAKIESIIKKELSETNPKLASLTQAYGAYYAEKIIKGEYWIGMTDKMARSSLGSPDNINNTTGSWGVHEQWVYSKNDIYLYFENGKLTSIQD